MFFESPALKNQNINFFKIGSKQISYSFPKPNDGQSSQTVFETSLKQFKTLARSILENIRHPSTL